MDFAEREFALSAIDKDGHSLRVHLQGQLSRARTPERRSEIEGELALPPFPDALRYLWTAFIRIRRRNAGNGFGATPITWADLDAYSRLSGLHLRPWEIETIERLDDALMTSMAELKPSEQAYKDT
ncbi:phage tail assembly chaperone [Devosia sp. A449]